MSQAAVTKYAQKSFLSNNGKFNSIFKEFYIANANFDVTQVTSMYIDKAMYRDSDGVYRSQIVLKVGGNEVSNFTIDHGTKASALAIFKQNEISQLVDGNMNTVLYFIIDWDTLTTGQRTTFDVSLTEAAVKEQANPSICLYKELLNNSQSIKFSQLSWRNLSWGGGTSFVQNNWQRLTTEKIQIKQGTKRIYLSAPNSNYKFEMYVFNNNDQKVSAFDNWNAGNAEMVLPNDAAYYIITAAKLNDSQLYEYEFVNDNLTAEIKYISSYSLHTLTVGNQNVREFSDEGNSAGGSLDPSTYLPLWKNQMKFLNCDFLTIIEWRDYFDHSDTMNTYNTLLKQFYPYHFEISNNKGLFSKIPCEFERKVRNYEYIIGKTVIDGKSLAVVSWVQGNLDNEQKVREDSQWMINQLVNFDLVIVAGDFNNEQGPQLLQVWLDNGFTLGNCGYWGEIDTCTDSAFTHSSNDNIVVKGFDSYDNFEKGEEKVGSDHYPVRAKLGYVI